MDVTPLIPAGRKIMQSYAGGVFKISGVLYETPVIVTPESVRPWAAPARFEELAAAHFEGLAGYDVLLLGAGRVMRLLPPALRAALKEQGISADAMDTGAACRTYNVLMAEGRSVAAALLPYI